MNEATCPRQEALLEALRRGERAAEVEPHLAVCPDCAEAAAMTAALLALAGDLERFPLPEPGRLWRQAARQARLAAARRVERVVQLTRGAAVVAAAVAVAPLALQAGPLLARWWGALHLERLLPASIPAMSGPAALGMALLVPAVAGLATLYWSWVEE